MANMQLVMVQNGKNRFHKWCISSQQQVRKDLHFQRHLSWFF